MYSFMKSEIACQKCSLSPVLFLFLIRAKQRTQHIHTSSVFIVKWTKSKLHFVACELTFRVKIVGVWYAIFIAAQLTMSTWWKCVFRLQHVLWCSFNVPEIYFFFSSKNVTFFKHEYWRGAHFRLYSLCWWSHFQQQRQQTKIVCKFHG